MKDTASSDQESGGPVPLAHKSDITGMGLGPPFMGSHVQDPSGYLRRSLGLPGGSLQHPFHLAALTSPVYPPSLLGPGFPPASIMASLSSPRGNTPMPPPLVPTSRGAALTNLHTTLATGHASRHADLLALLKDSARQQELLLALSKLSPSPSSSRSSSSSLTRGQYPSPPSPPPAQRLHEASPRRRSSERSSSVSPSSYLTPRNLNGESTPSSFSPRIFALSNLSPTSPPTREDSLGVPPRPPSTGRRASSSSAPRPDRVFTCRTCNRSFGYKHVLQNHERTHTGEKPFECPQCHKRFTRDHHLKTHMRLHTGEKPYHCTHCDRQFVQVANLRRHLRVHTGERPYSCETCPSRFSDSNQLKAHSLIHKGEKPYGCHGCRASFRRRHHLIQHKCSGDGSGSPGGSILPEEEAGFGYPGGELFPSDDVDEDELTDDGGASPMGTPIPSTMTVLTEEDEEDGTALVQERRRGRKNKEPRRLVANSTLLHSPALKDHLLRPTLPPTPLPEQTEPEDLSMSGSRNRRETPHTYRANIALTTSTPAARCPSYPMSYGPLDSATKDDDRDLLVNSYRAAELKPLGFNS